jgi:large subunit ribosomal protein L23
MKLNIINRPVVSEKALKAKEKINVYTFKVDKHATKSEIALLIQQFFGVKPIKIRTTMLKGKKLPMNRWRTVNYRADWKKAYVTLKKGDKIKELE